MNPERILTRSDFTDYCSYCGMALTQYEITADIQGNLVLFDEKTTGSIQMTLCSDCKNKLMEITLGGIEAAIHRRMEIDNVNRTKSGKRVRAKLVKKKKDDESEDESGGVRPLP